MASKTLALIIQESEALINTLLECEGEIGPDLEAQLGMSGHELKSKLDTYGYIIDGLKARSEYAMQRMRQWDAVAASCEKSLNNIKSRVKFALEQLDTPEVHGYEFTFKLQANPQSVIIDDETKIPAEFIITEVKTTTRPAKKEILEAIKDGREIPGAHVERSTRLVTKVSQRKEVAAAPALEKV
jgi:hypothetical protein